MFLKKPSQLQLVQRPSILSSVGHKKFQKPEHKKRWPWGKTKIEGLYSTLTAASVAVLFNCETFSKLFLIISCSVPQEVKVRSHRSTVNLK